MRKKLKSASSVGGIAGRNNSIITSCYVATEKNGGSIITARYGFVGGVAGANNGSISSSGSGAAFTDKFTYQVDGVNCERTMFDRVSMLLDGKVERKMEKLKKLKK